MLTKISANDRVGECREQAYIESINIPSLADVKLGNVLKK